MRSITVALLLLIAIALGACGQVSLKYGMKLHPMPPSNMVGTVVNLFGAILTPYVLLGLGLYAVSSCFWLLVLAKWQLSYAYPMIAISYIGVVFLSRLVFKEHVFPLQWLGILMMCIGLVLVVTFGSATGSTKPEHATALQEAAPGPTTPR